MSTTKPEVITPPDWDGLPTTLQADRWLLWRYEQNEEGKWRKTPYDPKNINRHADFTDPDTLATLAQTRAEFERGDWDGIGYASTADDQLVQIDLDKHKDITEKQNGAFLTAAMKIAAKIGSYAELSASGGVHVLVKGTWPRKKHRTSKVPSMKELEVYGGARNIYMTGALLLGLTYSKIIDNQEAINALASQHFPLDDEADDGGGASDDSATTDQEIAIDAGFDPLFQRLMQGKLLPGECGDHRSDADFALACKLARYASDPEQIRRIMMQSALRRDKWDRDDYLTATIDKALKANAGKPKWSRYRLTTGGLAQRFLDRYTGTFRYVSQQNRWLRWNGKFWENDEALHHERAMKSVLKRVYEEARIKKDDKLTRFAESRDNYGSLMSALALARSDQAIATAVKDLDRDPELINCNNGTLNLRTWEFKPHDPADLITKMANADYAPDARSDLWQRFIDESFVGVDPSVPRFLQTLGGYSLLGMAPEKLFMLLYGPQNSGKGTFIDVLLSVLGSYSDTIPFEALLKKRGSSENQPQLAKLPGVRVVGSNEGPKDRRWDTELLKTLAGGGDEISVAGKFQHPITFRVAFKIWLATNNLPQLDYDDSPAWGRVVIIRFPNEKKGREIDPQLRLSLVNDASQRTAIFSWLIEGYRHYAAEGIVRPLSVQKEVARYRRENDPIGDFVKQCCTVDRNACVATGTLFARYKTWYDENYPTSRYQPLTHRTFTKALERYDVKPSKSNGDRVLRGIAVNSNSKNKYEVDSHAGD